MNVATETGSAKIDSTIVGAIHAELDEVALAAVRIGTIMLIGELFPHRLLDGAMRRLGAQPLPGLAPPCLPEQVGLDVVDEDQQSILEDPALLGRILRVPDAQTVAVVLVAVRRAAPVDEDAGNARPVLKADLDMTRLVVGHLKPQPVDAAAPALDDPVSGCGSGVGRGSAQLDPGLQPRSSSCLGSAQYLWRKTSAWFSVTPAAVVTMLRLSPQLTNRRDPFDAIWL
jgi:hypothetical protein